MSGVLAIASSPQGRALIEQNAGDPRRGWVETWSELEGVPGDEWTSKEAMEVLPVYCTETLRSSDRWTNSRILTEPGPRRSCQSTLPPIDIRAKRGETLRHSRVAVVQSTEYGIYELCA